MSLRDELKALIREVFVEVLAESEGQEAEATAPKAKPTKEEAPKKKRKRRTKAQMEAADEAKADASDDELEDVDDEGQLSYEDFMTGIRKAISDAGTNEAKTTALKFLNDEFGVAKFKELDPSDFAACLKGVQDAIANG